MGRLGTSNQVNLAPQQEEKKSKQHRKKTNQFEVNMVGEIFSRDFFLFGEFESSGNLNIGRYSSERCVLLRILCLAIHIIFDFFLLFAVQHEIVLSLASVKKFHSLALIVENLFIENLCIPQKWSNAGL